MIWVLINLHFDNGLLPYFLRYYRERGVGRFGFITRIVPNELIADDIELEVLPEDYQSGPRDNDLLNEFRKKRLSREDWYIPADLDEFYWTPGLRNFHDLIGDWDHIPAKFWERLSRDGVIRPIDHTKTLDEQHPLGGHIINRLCDGGCDDKVAMARAHVITRSGHHFAENGFRAPFPVMCHHFKFTGKDFWTWMNHKESLWPMEVPPFRLHYQAHGRINVYDTRLGIIQSPPIGI